MTVYVNDLNKENVSAEEYIRLGITQLENDHSVTIIEQKEAPVGNRSAVRLVDSDGEGYQRMVYWIPSNDKVFEIAYNTKKEYYLDDLEIAESIINSFKEIEGSVRDTNNEDELTQITGSSPLDILKKRFATGEINEEDYLRMKRVLLD